MATVNGPFAHTNNADPPHYPTALTTLTSTHFGGAQREVLRELWRQYDATGYNRSVARDAVPIQSEAWMEMFVERMPQVIFTMELSIINYEDYPLAAVFTRTVTDSKRVTYVRQLYPVVSAQPTPEGVHPDLQSDRMERRTVTLVRSAVEEEEWTSMDAHRPDEGMRRRLGRVQQNASARDANRHHHAVRATQINDVFGVLHTHTLQLRLAPTPAVALSLEVALFGYHNRTQPRSMSKFYYTVASRLEQLRVFTGSVPKYNVVIVPPGTHYNELYENTDYYFESHKTSVSESRALAQLGPERLRRQELEAADVRVMEMRVPSTVDATAADLHPFDGVAVISKMFMLDMVTHADDVDITPTAAEMRRAGVVEVYTHERRGWTPFAFNEMAANAYVVTSDGVHPYVQRFINERGWNDRTDLSPRTHNIHPYVYRRDRGAALQATPPTHAYAPVRYWGDVEPEYRMLDRDVQFGVQAAYRLRQALAENGVQYAQLMEALALVRELSEVPLTANVRTYLTAVLAGNQPPAPAGNVAAMVSAGNREFNVPQLPQRTEGMPKVPKGYASVLHMRYLDGLRQNDDLRGWPPELFERVQAALHVLQFVYREACRMVVGSDLVSTVLLPFFLELDGDRDANAMTAFVFNVLHGHLSGLWYRPQPPPQDADELAQAQATRHAILRLMGVRQADGSLTAGLADPEGTQQPVLVMQQFEDVIGNLLTLHNQADQGRRALAQTLFSAGHGNIDAERMVREWFDGYARSDIFGKAYSNDPNQQTFAWLFAEQFVLPYVKLAANRDAQPAMLHALRKLFYSILATAADGYALSETLYDRKRWEELRRNQFAHEQQKRRPAEPVVPRAGDAERWDLSGYVHMRLLVDRRHLAQQYVRRGEGPAPGDAALPDILPDMRTPPFFGPDVQLLQRGGGGGGGGEVQLFASARAGARHRTTVRTELSETSDIFAGTNLRERMHHAETHETCRGDPLVQAFTMMFLTSRVSMASLAAQYEHGLPPAERSIIGLFAAINLLTSATILAVKGAGKLLEYVTEERDKWSDYERFRASSHNAWYSGAVVPNPLQLLVVPATLIRGVISGFSSTPVTSRRGKPHYRADDKGIHPPADVPHGSVIFMANGCEYARRDLEERGNPLCLVGDGMEFETAPGRRQLFEVDVRNGPQTPSIAYYRWLYGFSKLQFPHSAPSTFEDWRMQTRKLMRPAATMSQRGYDLRTQNVGVIIGTGHLDDVPVEDLFGVLTPTELTS